MQHSRFILFINLSIYHLLAAAILMFHFSGCAYNGLHSTQTVSSIDTKYIWNKVARSTDERKNSFVYFYQGIFKKTLGGNCTHYPSDSTYVSYLLRNCSTPLAIIKGMERYMREPDTPFLGYAAFKNKSIINYRSFQKNECEF